MSDRTVLLALLARVEGATGPDRELDIAIAEALFRLRRVSPELERSLGYMPGALEPLIILPNRIAGPTSEAIPEWTASIDTALGLVERILPGWGVTVGRSPDRLCQSTVFPPHARRAPFQYSADHKAGPSLAVLAALLRALSSQPEDGG